MFGCVFGSVMLWLLLQVLLDVNDCEAGLGHKMVQAFWQAYYRVG